MFISMILDAYRRFMARRRAVRELAELSDEDLADIGLTRCQVDGCDMVGSTMRPLI